MWKSPPSWLRIMLFHGCFDKYFSSNKHVGTSISYICFKSGLHLLCPYFRTRSTGWIWRPRSATWPRLVTRSSRRAFQKAPSFSSRRQREPSVFRRSPSLLRTGTSPSVMEVREKTLYRNHKFLSILNFVFVVLRMTLFTSVKLNWSLKVLKDHIL